MLNKSTEGLARRTATDTAGTADGTHHLQRLATSAGQHVSTIASHHGQRSRTTFEALARLQSELAGAGFARLAELGQAYLIEKIIEHDFFSRQISGI